MILTIQDILNTPRCEPWTDERTIEFMNSGVYTNIGEKTIQEFIQSVGVLDITFDEIIWIIINNLDNSKLVFSITDLFFLYADFLSLDDYKKQLSSFLFSSRNPKVYLDSFTEKYNNLLEIFKDFTDEIKLYKLTILFLTERTYNDGEYVKILKKVLNVGKEIISHDIIEEYYLNYLSKIYD